MIPDPHPHRPNVYAAAPLDRAAHRRKDAAWLESALTDPAARVLPLWRGQNLVTGGTESPRAATLPGPAARPLAAAAGISPVFLGLYRDAPLFALDLTPVAEPLALPELAGTLAGTGAAFFDLRVTGPLMEGGEAAVCAGARGLTWWNARHRFCGVCGAPAESAEGGHVRVCSNADCATHHFPRTDPAVIMLVHDGAGRCVLSRQEKWPAGMHSVLAGFVEPGESLEDAVAREVFEEVGLRVTDVRYRSSQPWPFPASLMLGFTARAVDTAITVDGSELESALWVSREEIRALPAVPPPDAPFRLARPDSIAHRLIAEWAAGND